MPWNRWPHVRGIDGHMRVEYSSRAVIQALVDALREKKDKLCAFMDASRDDLLAYMGNQQLFLSKLPNRISHIQFRGVLRKHWA